MSRSYAAMTTLITQKLQSAGTADFSVAEVDSAIEEGLKEFATYKPHLVPIVLQIESRYGTCSTTSANNLTDTTKGQFLTTDDDNQKVVHNTTDHTWAVISSVASTAQVGLTRDIFVANDNYRIYNRQCWNQKQLYMGDVPENYKVDSVEYPLGEERRFVRQTDNVLELKVDSVEDSNAGSTVTELPDVDVLVRLSKPHVLSQLTDWSATLTATAAAGATSLALTALQSAGTIEVGEEFTVQYHKSSYLVAASATIANSAVTLTFYPPLEAAVGSTATVISFRMTSLSPQQEDTFAELVAARLAVNKAPKTFNTITVGGGNVSYKYQTWGERKLAEVLRRLQGDTKPKVKHYYPTE